MVYLQNGREAAGGDLDYYSITVDDGEVLEQIRALSRQQGELQQQEVELRARVLAMEIQRSFESRSAEYENAAARMQVWIFYFLIEGFDVCVEDVKECSL